MTHVPDIECQIPLVHAVCQGVATEIRVVIAVLTAMLAVLPASENISDNVLDRVSIRGVFGDACNDNNRIVKCIRVTNEM